MHVSMRRMAAAAALALSFTASAAQAQALFGAAELDDDDTQLLLVGGAWSPGGLGWKPFGSVVAYMVRWDAGAGTGSRNVVVPTLGLLHAQERQSLSLGLGYAFSDENADEPILIGAESGDGVVGSVGYDYWGSGNRMVQVLGSYNFGTEFLWTRGRAATRLTPTSPLFVGGEAAILGGGSTNAFIGQFGPLLEWRFSPKFRMSASAGLKVGIAEVSGNAAYGRLEFLLLPTAR